MSAAMAAAAAAALQSRRNYSKRSSSGSSSMMIDSTYGHGRSTNQQYLFARQPTTTSSRYESQKQRDWNTFDQYRKNHKPVPLTLPKCSVEHVLDFLRCLDDDQFDETKQANWGSLDALVGRLRVAFEENGGRPARNPFGAPAVRSYLREVRDSQAKTRRDSLSG